MLNKFPCFRFKRKKANGESYELEFRANLLICIILAVVIFWLLAHGIDPTSILRLIPKFI